MMHAYFDNALELKFTNPDSGSFTGYGAVFGNMDSHGDVIMPGAFAASLKAHAASGTMPAMFMAHGPSLGGDPLPAGVWTSLAEDTKGLRAEGRLSALDTDYGRRVRGLMQDGALRDLSIGYKVSPGGATYGKAAGEPRRQLKALHLAEISLLPSGSNPLARVDGIKALPNADATAAADSLAKAMALHDKSMSSDRYDSGDSKSKAVIMSHLMDAHEKLTGNRQPDSLSGWKGSPISAGEFEAALVGAGLSSAQALHLMDHGFKSLAEPDAAEIKTELEDALRDLKSLFKR